LNKNKIYLWPNRKKYAKRRREIDKILKLTEKNNIGQQWVKWAWA